MHKYIISEYLSVPVSHKCNSVHLRPDVVMHDALWLSLEVESDVFSVENTLKKCTCFNKFCGRCLTGLFLIGSAKAEHREQVFTAQTADTFSVIPP